MPWDVFISHASEDKESVAEPLARALERNGISVWLDKEQVRLGDGFLDSVQQGLVASRYGVAILSPSFFAKIWPKSELAALFQREATSGKVILPVLHDLSLDQLAEKAPILAQRKAVFWADGVDSVVAAILEVINEESPKATIPSETVSPSHPTTSKPDSLVLIIPSTRKPIFVRADRIQAGEVIRLDLTPEDSGDSAALAALRSETRHPISLAYGQTGLLGRIESVEQIFEGDREHWNLSLREDSRGYGDPFTQSMSFGGISADELAEMRARRLLLAEEPTRPGHKGSQDINDTAFEIFLRGFSVPMEVHGSPFPALYKDLKNDVPFFLAAARLLAVLWLHLSLTVDSILELKLEMRNPQTLHVRFEGERPRRFANEAPKVIRIEGDCDLTA